MTPDEQTALSRKYIPLPLAFVPVEGGIAIFLCRGGDRELLELAPDASTLWTVIESQYRKDAENHEDRKHKPPSTPLYDFDDIAPDPLFNLNEVDFTI